MSYRLRAYRVAGGATCPAIIFYLLLYALLYVLKHVTRNGSVAANELHEVSRTTKMEEASLSFLFKLSMPSLHLLMPPRAADTLYEAGIPQRGSCPLHLTLALANRNRYLFCCHDWIRLDCIENSSLGQRQRLCPNDITDTITDITDIIPDICSASWTADLVARLVPLAAPRWFHVVAHQNDVQVNPSRYSRPWRCSGRSPVLRLLLKIIFGRVHYDRRSSSYGELDAFYRAAPPSRGLL